MDTVGMKDPITDLVDNFLLTNGSKLIAEVRALSIRFRPEMVKVPISLFSESSEKLQNNLEALLGEIQTLCARHDFARFLLLFRKVPQPVANDFIRAVRNYEDGSRHHYSAVFSEAVLFGTNCALKFCRHEPTLLSNNDRYRFCPPVGDVEDAVRLFLLCVLHRFELFVMNSVSRRDLVEPVSLDALLEVYNHRLKKYWKPQLKGTMSDLIVFPGVFRETLTPGHEWRWRDRAGTERVLFARNYLPTPCDADSEFRRFAYLDTPDFLKFSGINFSTFRKVWTGLNQLLVHTLPLLWPESLVAEISPDLLAKGLEQADDYCETAVGGGYPESIWEACHEIISRGNHLGSPTMYECRAVVDFLTYRRFDGDVRFIEQPFVFYPVSDRLLFWDYFRHAGLLRCLARNLTRQPGNSTTQNKKGEVLEGALKSAVSAIPGVTGVRKYVVRDNGRDVWDVDVGFVYRQILFLVDAKNEQKSVRYYFEAVEVSDKVVRRESLLAKMDENVRSYLAHVRQRWMDCMPIRGAICLVCTEEAEFIASADPKFWLSLFECPRICLLTELVDFLIQSDAIKNIEANPAFLPFSE